MPTFVSETTRTRINFGDLVGDFESSFIKRENECAGGRGCLNVKGGESV